LRKLRARHHHKDLKCCSRGFFFNFIALFILKGHGNKRDEGLSFMIYNNLRYCKQINLGDKEMFISLGRLTKSLVNVLIHQVTELEDKDQFIGSMDTCSGHSHYGSTWCLLKKKEILP
jgi:hypothetical protein